MFLGPRSPAHEPMHLLPESADDSCPPDAAPARQTLSHISAQECVAAKTGNGEPSKGDTARLELPLVAEDPFDLVDISLADEPCLVDLSLEVSDGPSTTELEPAVAKAICQSSAEDIPRRIERLSVECCSVVLLPLCLAASSRDGVPLPEQDVLADDITPVISTAPGVKPQPASNMPQDLQSRGHVLASGFLRLINLPQPPGALDRADDVLVLAVAPSGEASRLAMSGDLGDTDVCSTVDESSMRSFGMMCPKTMVFSVVGETLITFPPPEHVCGSLEVEVRHGGICGLLFQLGPQGRADRDAVAAELGAHGCHVRWSPTDAANMAADVARNTGVFVAGALELTGEAVGWSFRSLGGLAKKWSLVAPRREGPAEVPATARQCISVARAGTQTLLGVTKNVLEGVSDAAGWAAEGAHDHMPACSQQWHEDVKVVGKASLESGVDIWTALLGTTIKVASDAADTSADLIGHRYGEDAAATSRDGLHVVGNVVRVVRSAEPVFVAKVAASGAAGGLAGAGENDEAQAAETDVSGSAELPVDQIELVSLTVQADQTGT